jgi:GTP 3',8-cyclase
MIDEHNRHINYLRVSVTDRCNLRCRYCMPKEGLSLTGHEDILRYEEILRIIRVAVKMGVAKVRITGGEPLVRRGVVDFIAQLKGVEGLQDISLTTNGILLGNCAAGLFAAGVKRINISLDSLNAEKYGRITCGGDLAAVLRGIDAVRRIGFSPVKINVVVIKGINDDEVLDFAGLTLDKPYQVRFIELMPFGFNSSDRYLSNEVVMERIGAAYRLDAVTAAGRGTEGPARMYRIAGGVGEIGFISPLSHSFCSSCNRLRLTADGHLRACLLMDEEIDLKSPLREGCSDEDIEDLIRGAVLKKTGHHEATGGEGKPKKCAKQMFSIGG